MEALKGLGRPPGGGFGLSVGILLGPPRSTLACERGISLSPRGTTNDGARMWQDMWPPRMLGHACAQYIHRQEHGSAFSRQARERDRASHATLFGDCFVRLTRVSRQQTLASCVEEADWVMKRHRVAPRCVIAQQRGICRRQRREKGDPCSSKRPPVPASCGTGRSEGAAGCIIKALGDLESWVPQLRQTARLRTLGTGCWPG